MTDESKPASRHSPRKKRRLNPGRRRQPETDAPRSVLGDELQEIARTFARLRDLEPLHRKDADAVVRLIADVRRLRQLVIDAEPYVPDNDQTRTMDLLARLKAEVDRR
jgi:hypothetical protein